MSFTYDPKSVLGLLRVRIGDWRAGQGVLPDGSNFGDEDLQALLDANNGDTNSATVAAFETLAAVWSPVVNTQVGPIRESLSDASKAYRDRALAAREMYGVSSVAFSVGLLRNDGYAIAAENTDG